LGDLLLHAMHHVGGGAGGCKQAEPGRGFEALELRAACLGDRRQLGHDTLDRTALVTANAFSLPALMCGNELGRLSNIRSTLPPSKSISAGPEPRYGRWTM